MTDALPIEPTLPTIAQQAAAITCAECGTAIKDKTYVVRQDVIYCVRCAGVE